MSITERHPLSRQNQWGEYTQYILQLLGCVAKTVLATMKPIPGNDRVLLFYGNTPDINCSVTGTVSLNTAHLVSPAEVFSPISFYIDR